MIKNTESLDRQNPAFRESKKAEAVADKNIAKLSDMQKEVFEYNKKFVKIGKGSRTISEEEQIILGKYNGKKIDLDYFYENIEKFIVNVYGDMKKYSPCKAIVIDTECLIPDEYFYSFYLIPLKDDQKKQKYKDKELLAYITSRDGVTVYAAGFVCDGMIIGSEELEEELNDICCGEEDTPVYYNDLYDDYIDKFQIEMLEYDRKLVEKEKNIAVNKRTIGEEENIIINELGGEKVDSLYIDKFLDKLSPIYNIFLRDPGLYVYNFLDKFSVKGRLCLNRSSSFRIIYRDTGKIIPEEYFYSFYHIPLESKQKKPEYRDKELLAFISSRDGKNVYVADFLDDIIAEDSCREKLNKVVYKENGVAVYYDDMKRTP